MELEAATIDQIKRGHNGKMIVVEADVGNHVANIKRIDENLHVRYSELGQYYVVFHRDPMTGKENMLTTSQELDGRLVRRLEWLTSGDYDYLKEMEKLEAQRESANDARLKEQLGEIGERLAHAIRKDLGLWKDQARSKRAFGKGGIVGH